MNKQDEKLLQRARERYDRAVEAEQDNREAAREDLRFAYGDQWSETAIRIREIENRPCLTINKIPKFTRAVLNDIRQTRPAVKTRPVDSAGDPKTADVLNGMVRAIEQDSSAESAYDWAVQYAIDMGWGYWRILTEYESEYSFDQVARIQRIKNPFSVFLDCDAIEQDKSDMKWAFVVDHMDKEAFEAKYPKARSEWPEEPSQRHNNRWYTESKIRVAEYWEMTVEPSEIHQMMDGTVVEGDISDEFMIEVVRSRKIEKRTVMQYLLTGAEVLERTEWLGKYIPIVEVLGEEVDIEGDTVLRGMVRDMKDSQRSYNYARSAAAEDVALRSKSTVMGPKGAFTDPKWRNMNTKSYPYLEYGGQVAPQLVPEHSPDPKLIQEMLQGTEEMKEISGIYDPALGQRSNEVSGIAIDSRKKQSQISNFHFADNLAKAMKYTGRILVDLIPKLYDTPRVVQILKPDGTEESVRINQQGLDAKGNVTDYNLTTGRYDVIVDIGPSYSTQREEAVSTMLELLKAFPGAVQVMGDLVAKNMDWPEADELAKRLKLLLPMDIAAEENPQFKMAMQQYEQIIQQGKQYIGALEAQIQEMAKMLQEKDRELTVKERAQALDEQEAVWDTETNRAKLELEYSKNVPGSAV